MWGEWTNEWTNGPMNGPNGRPRRQRHHQIPAQLTPASPAAASPPAAAAAAAADVLRVSPRCGTQAMSTRWAVQAGEANLARTSRHARLGYGEEAVAGESGHAAPLVVVVVNLFARPRLFRRPRRPSESSTHSFIQLIARRVVVYSFVHSINQSFIRSFVRSFVNEYSLDSGLNFKRLKLVFNSLLADNSRS